MNKVVLMGRFVRDPEIRYTPTGKVVCQFTLAVTRDYKNSEGHYDADFINCVAWGKTAEMIGNTFAKGKRILVTDGSIRIRSYVAKDGSKRWVNEVLVTSFEYVEKKEGNKVEPSADDGFIGMGTEVPIPFDEEIPF